MPGWEPSNDYRSRCVAVVGAGVLGRRIACVWASGGFNVVVYDPNTSQCDQAREYAQQNVHSYAQKTRAEPGRFDGKTTLQDAVQDAWLVIECVPERLEAKIKIFGELVKLARPDAILATNSSSYRSSEMLAEVPEESKQRILNMHYYMPPACMVVELMTDGFTSPSIIDFLVTLCREVGTLPYVARKESTGFIFNRLWAAVKRETLTILAEGVSTPEEIDSMWAEMFLKGGSLPCKTMDAVGLDTVAFIESHYVAERKLSSQLTVDFLKQNYLDAQKLGDKSPNGGLYAPFEKSPPATGNTTRPRILALDVGIASGGPSNSGEVFELDQEGNVKSLVRGQALPDGLVVDSVSNRMFWTCMGTLGQPNGAVYSANPDGSDISTVVPPGAVHTPKQLTLDSTNQMVYFCDREGQSVLRCRYDGSQLQQIVSNPQTGGEEDPTQWCVGIALSTALGKIFWTQKGPSKGGKGRIFSANLPSPDETHPSAQNAHCLLDNLPEPIDLEFDEQSRTIYWTDRGELPSGNTLNSVQLDETGSRSTRSRGEILARHFHEAIGLKLDLPRKTIYVADLGGSIYAYSLDTKTRTRLFSDEERAFTGVTCL